MAKKTSPDKDLKTHIEIVRCTLERVGELNVEVERIRSPEDAYKVLSPYFKGLDREHLVVMALNIKNEPVLINTVSIGTITSSVVDAALVFKPAIIANAVSIVCAHNHVSNSLELSSNDIEATLKLEAAGKILNIQLLDHMIVTDSDFLSIKEKGYF